MGFREVFIEEIKSEEVFGKGNGKEDFFVRELSSLWFRFNRV